MQQVEDGEEEHTPKTENQLKFERELEFVQCFANPFFLQSLAQDGYFEDERFNNYIKYLSYWKKPEYVRFIQYPQCLHHLDLLSNESFITAIKDDVFVRELSSKQIMHWAKWKGK